MSDLISKFEKDMNIQALKYTVGKQMFCKYTNKVLDYRNAILLTVKKGKQTFTVQALHGSLENKLGTLISRLESVGMTAETFVNITPKNKAS